MWWKDFANYVAHTPDALDNVIFKGEILMWQCSMCGCTVGTVLKQEWIPEHHRNKTGGINSTTIQCAACGKVSKMCVVWYIDDEVKA